MIDDLISEFINFIERSIFYDKLFLRKKKLRWRREILNFYICNLIIIISKRNILSE
jgi:hypothetical protein